MCYDLKFSKKKLCQYMQTINQLFYDEISKFPPIGTHSDNSLFTFQRRDISMTRFGDKTVAIKSKFWVPGRGSKPSPSAWEAMS